MFYVQALRLFAHKIANEHHGPVKKMFMEFKQNSHEWNLLQIYTMEKFIAGTFALKIALAFALNNVAVKKMMKNLS